MLSSCGAVVGRTVQSAATPPFDQPKQRDVIAADITCACSQRRAALASATRSRDACTLRFCSRHCEPMPRDPNESGNSTTKPLADQKLGPFGINLRLGRGRALDEAAAIVQRHHGRKRPGSVGPIQRGVQREVAIRDVDWSGAAASGGSLVGSTVTAAEPGEASKNVRKIMSANRVCKLWPSSKRPMRDFSTARGCGRRQAITRWWLSPERRNDYVAAVGCGGGSAIGAPARAAEAHLLNRTDRPTPMPGEADVKYLDGDFRVVRPGAFVRCAVTGVPIPLEELRYWSVDLQEAYATPEAVLQRHGAGYTRKK